MIDAEKVGYWELKSLCGKSGFKQVNRMFYLRPGFRGRFKDGLVSIYDDDSARDLSKLLLQDHEVHVYVEHIIDEPKIVEVDCFLGLILMRMGYIMLMFLMIL